MDPKITSLEELYDANPGQSTTEAKANAEPESPPSEAAEPSVPAAEVKDGTPAVPAKTEPPGAGKGDAAPVKTDDGKKGAPPAPDDDESLPADVQGLQAALKASRQKARERGTKVSETERRAAEAERKAQELEQTAQQMWAQLQQLQPHAQGQHQAHQPQPQQQPPDPMTDPVGFAAWQEQRFAHALQTRDAQYEHQIYMSRVVPSQRIMRSQVADYDEMEAMFAEAAKADPRLWQEIKRHEFPAEYAYNVGKQLKMQAEIKNAGSMDAYIQRLVEDRVANLQPPQPQVPTVPTNPSAPKAPPPQSLARVPSVTPRNAGKTYQGPTPLADLYK